MTDTPGASVPQLNVLVTGGSGASGIAVARALHSTGHRVFTVGSDQARIDAAAQQAGEGVTGLVCDLAVMEDVRQLRSSVAAAAGPVDAVIHLVGGWRGAQGIADQTDEDWDFLERGAITTLRNVTRVFYDDIAASRNGRFAMVSSTAVEKPAAATASYVAAKAAAEAWTMAMADGFRRAAGNGSAPSSGAGTDNATHVEGGAAPAAVVLVVKALVDDAMRHAHPERSFPGGTDVEDLARAVVGLFKAPADGLNGTRLRLAP
ncbi:NADP-dependent 3-hydroxy acid dehydrogenase YdfG [Arthrobacter sp. 9AX]|uniref:SDR family oxidoreductase n=1 Tax=Arthrobacter sp. 9AX TaxID=2653131 RepID=UPI0012F21646|nr:SDR family NAD(P)-dependent oxidoreductase [Arthrobacter sp. 9AX]VXB16324.1 NADP-dependent 3-hydroxy acid dehydrogenase YdfG [Arthrobacter sp. 9AX]